MEDDLVNRLNTSVRFLKDNLTFKVGEFVLGVIDSKTIFVNVYSSFYFVQNLSKAKATDEFNEMKNNFQKLKSKAKDFLSFVKDKNIEYNLVLDSGGAGIIICKEKKGILEFFI